MNDKVRAAVARAAARLQSLSKEEFFEKLRFHSQGEIARALVESYEFAASYPLSAYAMFSLQMASMKVSQALFIPQEVLCYEPQVQIVAANDENYLMAA